MNAHAIIDTMNLRDTELGYKQGFQYNPATVRSALNSLKALINSCTVGIFNSFSLTQKIF